MSAVIDEIRLGAFIPDEKIASINPELYLEFIIESWKIPSLKERDYIPLFDYFDGNLCDMETESLSKDFLKKWGIKFPAEEEKYLIKSRFKLLKLYSKIQEVFIEKYEINLYLFSRRSIMKLDKKTIKEWKNLLPIEWRVQLNSSLIEQQDLGIDDVAKVFAAHGKRLHLFNQARTILQKAARKGKLSKKKQEEMREINDALEMAEYQAQEGWKFKRDDKYHIWWIDLPGCTCPKMDNADLRGMDMRITDENCPWHNWIYAQDPKEKKNGH